MLKARRLRLALVGFPVEIPSMPTAEEDLGRERYDSGNDGCAGIGPKAGLRIASDIALTKWNRDRKKWNKEMEQRQIRMGERNENQIRT